MIKILFTLLCVLVVGFSQASELVSQGQTLLFKWDDQQGKETVLEVKFNSPKNSGKLYKTTANSYRLTLKKLPRKIYWRVSSDASKQFKVKQLDNKYVLRAGATYEKADYSVESSTLDKNVSATGSGLYATAELFPDFLNGNKSIRMGYSSSSFSKGSNKLTRSELDLEIGFLLKKTENHHHLYVGFYRYNLDYDLGDSDAEYYINFLSGRYVFKKHLSEKVDLEINFLARFPYQVMFNPSFNLRPTLIYKYSEKFGIEGFLTIDQFKARAKEKTLDQHVDLNTFSYGAGLGLIVGW